MGLETEVGCWESGLGDETFTRSWVKVRHGVSEQSRVLGQCCYYDLSLKGVSRRSDPSHFQIAKLIATEHL